MGWEISQGKKMKAVSERLKTRDTQKLVHSSVCGKQKKTKLEDTVLMNNFNLIII